MATSELESAVDALTVLMRNSRVTIDKYPKAQWPHGGAPPRGAPDKYIHQWKEAAQTQQSQWSQLWKVTVRKKNGEKYMGWGWTLLGALRDTFSNVEGEGTCKRKK